MKCRPVARPFFGPKIKLLEGFDAFERFFKGSGIVKT
jgi:hypothetical protein